jgi:hypothetical protein
MCEGRLAINGDRGDGFGVWTSRRLILTTRRFIQASISRWAGSRGSPCSAMRRQRLLRSELTYHGCLRSEACEPWWCAFGDDTVEHPARPAARGLVAAVQQRRMAPGCRHGSDSPRVAGGRVSRSCISASDAACRAEVVRDMQRLRALRIKASAQAARKLCRGCRRLQSRPSPYP